MIVGVGIQVSNNLLPGSLVYIGLSVLDAITGYSVAGEAAPRSGRIEINVPGPDDTTTWQTVGTVGALVLTGAGTSIWKFVKSQAAENSAATKQIVLDCASIADIRPLLEKGVDIKSLLLKQRQQTSDTKAIRELLEPQDEEREDDVKIQQAIAKALEDLRPSPRTRRKTS